MGGFEAGRLLHEGKSKMVLEAIGPDGQVVDDLVVLRFKDDATAFDGTKRDTVADKGLVNAAISNHLLRLVAERGGVRSHLVEELSPTELLCVKVEIVPIEVVVRNVLAGSICRRFGLEEGRPLEAPLVEFFYKSDPLHDPPIADVHALAFGWAEAWELAYLRHAALKVNEVLRTFWDELGVDLVDFKLEFGRAPTGALLLADEISPDGCRLWEKGTGRKLDKDVFRRDLGDLGDTYRELYRRVFGRDVEG